MLRPSARSCLTPVSQKCVKEREQTDMPVQQYQAFSCFRYSFLQDLFVTDGTRGLGVGRALIEAVYERAKAAGASRVHWLTHTANAQARILYDQVADNPGFIQYRKIL